MGKANKIAIWAALVNIILTGFTLWVILLTKDAVNEAKRANDLAEKNSKDNNI